jgi:hypothetical protein
MLFFVGRQPHFELSIAYLEMPSFGNLKLGWGIPQ